MATPHVTGVASMVWGADPNLTGAEVKEVITSTADRPLTFNNKAYKIVNALKAVESIVDKNQGIVSGTVKSAVDSLSIEGAKIVVDNNLSYYTINDGTFSIPLGANNPHTLKISKEGYTDVTYHNVQVENNGETHLTTILQLPKEYENIQGKVKGQIVNALTGAGMPNLTIKIRKDINNQSGEVIDTITTGENGMFTTGNLTNGVYTGQITSNNTVTTYFNFICINEISDAGVISVTPLLSDNEMRIVLTWGENPRDLDSHIKGQGQHIYFSNRIGTGVNLDHDDTQSYGPETITIDFDKIPKGIYDYYVHWWTGSGTWSTSEAKVQVYTGNELMSEFYVPNSLTGSSGNWNVFRLNTETKQIIPSLKE